MNDALSSEPSDPQSASESIGVCDYCEDSDVINVHGMRLCYPCAIWLANVEYERAAK